MRRVRSAVVGVVILGSAPACTASPPAASPATDGRTTVPATPGTTTFDGPAERGTGSTTTTTLLSTSTTSTSTAAPATSLAPASSATTITTVPPAPVDSPAWAAADAALRRRVNDAGLRGGALIVVRGDEVLHDTSVGGVTRATALPVASAAKWFTAALLLTLVEDGTLSLDDPIERWLPAFPAPMTLRHLLSHTAGIPEDDCLWDPGDTLARCVDRLAQKPRRFVAGTAFAYGNSSFHVAGRLAEVAAGRSFATLFAERIGGPLGMASTGFGGGRNPSPAAGATTSADDYLRFMRMVASGGTGILSASSIDELRRDQTAGHDTGGDYAVGITRIPTYGFGLWRDKVDPTGRAVIISGNGGRGFYPWIDDETATLGVLAVDDVRGAEVAVPASRAVVDLAIAAVPRP